MSKEDANAEIFKAIELVAKELPKYPATAAAAGLRDLGVAYRALSGGAQVGGLFVEK